ncbi:hypothetical protein DFH08DRAFT_50516 [Mycena albidolilacea]|uniref:Uncharacterized protein n=1 Tax=Mycena albidolilacea TaxID=1033008 RepID=A0AAD7EA70_9AGAR|nr:hypothetical protein DFH08DRAFT_50516 [Mycena albidolilacea]
MVSNSRPFSRRCIDFPDAAAPRPHFASLLPCLPPLRTCASLALDLIPLLILSSFPHTDLSSFSVFPRDREASSTAPVNHSHVVARGCWTWGRSEDVSKGARRSIHYNLRRPRHEAWKRPPSTVVVAPGLPRHFFDGRFFVRIRRLSGWTSIRSRPRGHARPAALTRSCPRPPICAPRVHFFCNPRSTRHIRDRIAPMNCSYGFFFRRGIPPYLCSLLLQ